MKKYITGKWMANKAMFTLHTQDRFETDPVRKSDWIGLLFTRDCSGTGPERIQADAKTEPADVQRVQF